MSHGIFNDRGGATWWPAGAVAPSRLVDNLTKDLTDSVLLYFIHILPSFLKTYIYNLMIGLNFVVDGNKTLKTTF